MSWVFCLGRGGGERENLHHLRSQTKIKHGGKVEPETFASTVGFEIGECVAPAPNCVQGKAGTGVVSKGRDGKGIHGQGAGDSMTQHNETRNATMA